MPVNSVRAHTDRCPATVLADDPKTRRSGDFDSPGKKLNRTPGFLERQRVGVSARKLVVTL